MTNQINIWFPKHYIINSNFSYSHSQKYDFSTNGFNDFVLLTCLKLYPPNNNGYLHINVRKDKLCMLHMLIHATSKPYPWVFTYTCDCVINDRWNNLDMNHGLFGYDFKNLWIKFLFWSIECVSWIIFDNQYLDRRAHKLTCKRNARISNS